MKPSSKYGVQFGLYGTGLFLSSSLVLYSLLLDLVCYSAVVWDLLRKKMNKLPKRKQKKKTKKMKQKIKKKIKTDKKKSVKGKRAVISD